MAIDNRFNPVREMVAMQRAMDRLFDTTLSRTRDAFENGLSVDVHESDTAYTVLANLPGVHTDHLEVTFHDGALTINAELHAPEVAEGSRVLVQERPYGKYTRTMRLGTVVDAEKIETDYSDGVLTITLPKHETQQPRRIPIRKREDNS